MIDKNQLPPSEGVTDSEETSSAYTNLLDYFRLPNVASQDVILPDYWSKERDERLMDIYINNPFASSVVQTIVKILAALPFTARPSDVDDDEQQLAAEISQAIFDRWWSKVVEQATTSLLVQDNGMFIELTGAGEADKEIEPTPVPETNQFVYVTGFRFLESARCTRTNLDETPVRFLRDDGKEVLLHHSRVLFFADAPSNIDTLFGVGLCGLSRTIQFIQNGYDVITLENESIKGVAPGIFYGINWPNPPSKSGEGSRMEQVFQGAYMRNRESGRQVWQSPISVFPRGEGIEELKYLQLGRYPEGFNKGDSFQLIMQFLAMGFGFETRTFWPASQTGATKADAELSHLKEKSKFLAWFIAKMCDELNEKFAPDGVEFIVDYIDDEQDFRSAEVTEKRIGYLTTAINSNLLDRQTALELMVEDDIISLDQFERMMLKEQEAEERRQEMAEQLPPQPPPQQPEQGQEQEAKSKKKAVSDDFSDDLESLIEEVHSGEISDDEFDSEMEALIVAAALAAWREGSDEQTPTVEQQAEIDSRLSEVLPYVVGFGATVLAAEFVDSIINNHVPMWTSDIRAIFELGKLHNPNIEYLRWQVSANKEHCSDCARLNQQVHTRDEWDKSGWRPQSRALACTGRRCGCSLVATSGPSSGGF